MRGMHEEVEIKIRVGSAGEARARIGAMGFVETRGREFEANVMFDTGERSLRRRGEVLRVRESGGRGLITYKGPGVAGRHKRREEIETEVADARAMEAMLERLGYERVFRYEKYRAEYGRPGEAGVVTVDETPVGVFYEIEGEAEWIDATARLLGYGEKDYVTASYGRLYEEHRSRHAEAPADMVFGGEGEAGGNPQ